MQIGMNCLLARRVNKTGVTCCDACCPECDSNVFLVADRPDYVRDMAGAVGIDADEGLDLSAAAE